MAGELMELFDEELPLRSCADAVPVLRSLANAAIGEPGSNAGWQQSDWLGTYGYELSVCVMFVEPASPGGRLVEEPLRSSGHEYILPGVLCKPLQHTGNVVQGISHVLPPGLAQAVQEVLGSEGEHNARVAPYYMLRGEVVETLAANRNNCSVMGYKFDMEADALLVLWVASEVAELG